MVEDSSFSASRLLDLFIIEKLANTALLETEMEYTINTYKYQRGKIFTTTDNHKYLKYKVKENKAYMKCVLFRNGCKATAKLNLNTNLINPMINHDHTTSQYKSEQTISSQKYLNSQNLEECHLNAINYIHILRPIAFHCLK